MVLFETLVIDSSWAPGTLLRMRCPFLYTDNQPDWDPLYYGTSRAKTYTGNVKLNGVNQSGVTVFLYYAATGMYVDKTTTDSSGNFSFSHLLDVSQGYFAVAKSTSSAYNYKVLGYLTPG